MVLRGAATPTLPQQPLTPPGRAQSHTGALGVKAKNLTDSQLVLSRLTVGAYFKTPES